MATKKSDTRSPVEVARARVAEAKKQVELERAKLGPFFEGTRGMLAAQLTLVEAQHAVAVAEHERDLGIWRESAEAQATIEFVDSLPARVQAIQKLKVDGKREDSHNAERALLREIDTARAAHEAWRGAAGLRQGCFSFPALGGLALERAARLVEWFGAVATPPAEHPSVQKLRDNIARAKASAQAAYEREVEEKAARAKQLEADRRAAEADAKRRAARAAAEAKKRQPSETEQIRQLAERYDARVGA